MNITDENCTEIAEVIRGRKQQMLSLNEADELKDFERAKNVIKQALEDIYPQKSIFEK